MASIDHTCIVFKNGKYLPDHLTWKWDENENFVSLLPFEHNRDGKIIMVRDPFGKLVDIQESTGWYRDEYDAIYTRAGYRQLFGGVRFTLGNVWSWLKYHLHIMEKDGYRKEVGTIRIGGTEVYIYHNDLKESYVSFYRDASDTYVVIGGYGHYQNVYCHFMARGYGMAFEEKMASEAYQWACEDVLSIIGDSVYENWQDSEAFTDRMRKIFGYKDPFKRVEEGSE